MTRYLEFAVEQGDICEIDAEIVTLKYAQAHKGADKAVSEKLVAAGIDIHIIEPPDNQVAFVGTRQAMTARSALFIGMPHISQFGYPDVRHFMQRTLMTLQSRAPGAAHVAMTVHGVAMYVGLDEKESFLAQFLVCLAEAQTGGIPLGLKRITIVDHNSSRVDSLRHTLELFLSNQQGVTRCTDGWGYRLPVGIANKGEIPHVFVAMAFDEAMDDVFYFGIQRSVIAAGLLCDRVDKAAHFRGDIVDRIKDRIDSAALVIADLTMSRPNVFFEAGYAQGKGKEPLLIIDQAELADCRQLQFDIRTSRCLKYDPKDLPGLQAMLARELNQFILSGGLERWRASLASD